MNIRKLKVVRKIVIIKEMKTAVIILLLIANIDLDWQKDKGIWKRKGLDLWRQKNLWKVDRRDK